MLAVNDSTIRNQLKDDCDKVADDCETVIVTCEDEKKAAKNAAYLEKIDRAMAQIAAGKGTFHELIEDR